MAVLIVEADFYKEITGKLAEDAMAFLKEKGIEYHHITVPGALEIPAAISFAAESDLYDAYVALGCVIRGETYHFEVVSDQSAKGVNELAILFNLAIGNGILTVESTEQANERAFGRNKGRDAAEAALRMLELKKQFVPEGIGISDLDVSINELAD